MTGQCHRTSITRGAHPWLSPCRCEVACKWTVQRYQWEPAGTFHGDDLIHDHIGLSNAAFRLVQEHLMGSSQALGRPHACIPRQRAGVDVVGVCAESARQAAQLLGSCRDAEEAVRMRLRPLGELCMTNNLSALLMHNVAALLSGTCCRRRCDRLGALQAECTGHALRPC